jgi:hypothetical protein
MHGASIIRSDCSICKLILELKSPRTPFPYRSRTSPLPLLSSHAVQSLKTLCVLAVWVHERETQNGATCSSLFSTGLLPFRVSVCVACLLGSVAQGKGRPTLHFTGFFRTAFHRIEFLNTTRIISVCLSNLTIQQKCGPIFLETRLA